MDQGNTRALAPPKLQPLDSDPAGYQVNSEDAIHTYKGALSDYMRQASRTAEAGVDAGIEACTVGASENDVAAAIHDAQTRAGSEYTGMPEPVQNCPNRLIAIL